MDGPTLTTQCCIAGGGPAGMMLGPLLARHVTHEDLRRVQQRRELPTRLTQRAQVLIQNRVVDPALRKRALSKGRLPLSLRLAKRIPALRRIPARLIGLGVRPAHIHTPAASPLH